MAVLRLVSTGGANGYLNKLSGRFKTWFIMQANKKQKGIGLIGDCYIGGFFELYQQLFFKKAK